MRRRKTIGGVVAVGEGVEHAGGAVGAAVAGIAHVAGEGNRAVRGEGARGLLHEQADFPVAGVVTERDGRSVGCADAALRGENEKLFPEHRGGRPTHAGVLRHAEEIAAGHIAELVGLEREAARRPGGGGAEGVDGIGGGEKRGRHVAGGRREVEAEKQRLGWWRSGELPAREVDDGL